MKDSFGRDITYLRLSVTDRCNLRCRYCMPADGIFLKEHSRILTQEEIVSAVSVCSELGIKKVRITGGEPLVKKNIIEICSEVAHIDGVEELCLTTNGILLPSYSEKLVNAGVKRVNISLDTLNEQKYSYITRTGSLNDVLNGIKTAIETGFEKVKINCVLMKGFNDDEVRSLAELTLKYPVDVRFIELMPMTEMKSVNSYIQSDFVLKTVPELEKCREDNKGVSENYSFPDALGKVGLISAISNKFCCSCNRIRITADGFVKSCLHSHLEYNIKGLNYDEMKKTIESAIISKPKCRPEFKKGCLSEAGKGMNLIGG